MGETKHKQTKNKHKNITIRQKCITKLKYRGVYPLPWIFGTVPERDLWKKSKNIACAIAKSNPKHKNIKWCNATLLIFPGNALGDGPAFWIFQNLPITVKTDVIEWSEIWQCYFSQYHTERALANPIIRKTRLRSQLIEDEAHSNSKIIARVSLKIIIFQF